jgi:hypothetical protein
MRTFGDRERVLVVDVSPGTVIDSPKRDVYRVELDSGDVVERAGDMLWGLEPGLERDVVKVTIKMSGNHWKLAILAMREGAKEPTVVYRARCANLDAALEQLGSWRRGVIIV